MRPLKALLKLLQLPISFFISHMIKYKLYRIKYQCIKKRIFIDCTEISNMTIPHGIPRVVQNIARTISKISNSNDIEIITTEFYDKFIIKKPLSECDGIHIINRKSKSPIIAGLLKVKFYFYAYMNVIKTGPNDIILYLNHFPYLKHHAVAYFKNQTGGHIIYMIHDLIPIRYPQFTGKGEDLAFKKWICATFKYADGYITVSNATKMDLILYMKERKVDPDSYYIGNIILGSNFKVSIDHIIDIRDYIKKIFAKNRSVYLTVSTIEPRKNHLYLLSSFERLWAEGIDATLLIVGQIGWMVDELIQKIVTHEKFGIQLFMVTDANDKEIIFCYRNSKAFLFPSYIEGFGLPIIESLYNNLPALVSDIEIHREVGGDSVGYFDIENPDSLSSIIKKIETGTYSIPIPKESATITSWEESSSMLMKEIKHIITL